MFLLVPLDFLSLKPSIGFSSSGSWISREESCLLYTSDAADERSSVDLGGRRIIKKKNAQDERDVGNTAHRRVS